jgi:hypothetical protein
MPDFFLNDYFPILPKIPPGRNDPFIFRLLRFLPAAFLPGGKREEININENRDFQLYISSSLRGGISLGSNPSPRRIGVTASYTSFRSGGTEGTTVPSGPLVNVPK